MDRETALGQLREIRREILAIHTETEECQALQRQAEALQKEKEHPAPPAVQLKPEDTCAQLRQSFERQNRERLENSNMPSVLTNAVNAAIQAAVSVILWLDIFGGKGIFIPESSLELINAEGGSNPTVLFAVHILLAAAAVSAPLLRKSFRYNTKRAVIFGVPTALILCAYLMICGMIKSFAYPALLLGGAAVSLTAGGIARAIRKARLKAPTAALSAAQKKQIAQAASADGQAKEENARRTAKAQELWDEERRQRLPEIDRELSETVQRFNESRRRISLHMERLDGMDALCEDDKKLQTVDLLIRFIETRRADSVKEALQEYDKLMANRQLLEIEKQKLAAELKRASIEHADRMQQLEQQRRHQSEMEYLAWDSAQSRAKMVSQLDHIGAMLYYGQNS